MTTEAKLPSRKTNTSACKTTCTRLLHSDVAPTTVQQLSGHKNIASVNNYAVASNKMQHKMSNILCGVHPEQNIAVTTESLTVSNLLGPSTSSEDLNTTNSNSIFNQVNERVTNSQSHSHFQEHSFNISGNCTVQYINKYCTSPKKKGSRMIIYSDSE